ncbi:hypothetical protein GCM10028793_20740 [Nocardiopsis oceani]
MNPTGPRGGGVGGRCRLTEAEQAQRGAERAQQKAVRKAGCTVAKLQERGLSNREIARYLRISPQRVSQISRRQAAVASQQ